MSYTRPQARKLLKTAEFELFAASRADAVSAFTAARLRGKIRRTRNLRDKFQDLLKRQRLATRARTGTKAGASGVANQRTRQKMELFAEVLKRFEKRLAQIEVAEARAASQKTAMKLRLALSRKRRADAVRAAARRLKTSAKAPAKPPGPVTKGPRHTRESARSAQSTAQFRIAGQQAIRGHVAAKGRRNQAKRDNRG